MNKKLFVVYCLLFVAGCLLFVKDAEAKVLLPNAGGSNSGWTGTYTDVDEYPANDGETTFNSVSAAASQSYNVQDNSDNGSIRGVRVVIYAKFSGTQEKLYPLLRVGGIDYTPAECTGLNNSEYKFCSYYWSTKPGGGSWSVSDLNSLEAGMKTEETGAWEDAVYKVSQVYIDVDFKSETKKTKYHLFQKVNAVNGAVNEQFTFSIGDPVDEVRSAFIEIKGLAAPNAVSLGVKVDNDAATPGSYDATYAIDSAGRPTLFRINYDVTDYFKSFINSAGDYQRYIHLNANNDIYLLNAKLVLTYAWIIPPATAGQYRAKTEVISSIFDTTGSADGPSYNSVIWKGDIYSGKVRIKIATSDSADGPWSYLGPAPNCSATDSGDSDWYVVNADTPTEIKCSTHNNKRYFRYKAQLCSASDCLNSGNGHPEVNDVIVSWSP